jgi:hypothetical protein
VISPASQKTRLNPIESDTFVFGLGDGNDTIEDFLTTVDTFLLEDGLIIGALDSSANVGGDVAMDTVVELLDGATVVGTVTLLDVSLTDAGDLFVV